MKRRVLDGRMISESDTRTTIRPLTDADKYRRCLKSLSTLTGLTVEELDRRVVKVMDTKGKR